MHKVILTGGEWGHVGVTVRASMGAGVVSTDVLRCNTTAKCALAFVCFDFAHQRFYFRR